LRLDVPVTTCDNSPAGLTRPDQSEIAASVSLHR
jgi:hypothetical protein